MHGRCKNPYTAIRRHAFDVVHHLMYMCSSDHARRILGLVIAYAAMAAGYSLLTRQYNAVCNRTIFHHLLFGDSRFCVGMHAMSRSIEVAAQAMFAMALPIKAAG